MHNLSDDELEFQLNPANWRMGPWFVLRFFVNEPFSFSDFELALQEDPLRIEDSRFNMPSRILFKSDTWPICAGARYYDFQRPGRREPSVVFSPNQYLAVAGEGCFTHGAAVELGVFLPPVLAFACRIKAACRAHEALVFLEDFYPRKEPETEVFPGVFLSEPILHSIRRPRNLTRDF